jgi:protein-S-isoprenylcysteine O-methyltransferase Ste14
MSEPDHPDVVAPPVAIHLGFVLLGAGGEYLWPSSAGQAGIAWYATAAAAIAAGLLLIVWAGLTFRSRGTRPEPWKPSTAVVDSGPYRFSRNPMYLAFGVIHVGIGIAVGSTWIIATVVPTLLVMRYGVIEREERYLEAKFGNTYLCYKWVVRRWL